MDQQSQQPMLGGAGAASGRAMEMDTETSGRKPTFGRSRNKCLVAGLIAAVVLCLFLVVIIFLLTYLYMTAELCVTPQCIRSAASILTLMDTSVDPCDNFNDFVCGRWSKTHYGDAGKVSWFTELTNLINKDTSDFLKQKDSAGEPEAVHKVRRLYRSCMDTVSMAKYGDASLSSLLEDTLGLTYLPPVKGAPHQQSMRTAALIKRNLDLGAIIEFDLAQLPQNKSVMKLAFSHPGEEYLAFYTKPKKGGRLKRGVRVPMSSQIALMKFLKHFQDEEDDDEENYADAAQQMLRLDLELDAIRDEPEVKKRIANVELHEYKLKEFQKHLDESAPSGKSKLKLKLYLQTMFERNPEVKFDFDGEDTILISNEPYMERVSKMLDDFTEAQIELYLWYRVVYSLASHVTPELITARRQYDGAIAEEADVELKFLNRHEVCLDTVSKLMKAAVSQFLVSEPSIDEKRSKVTEMIKGLKESFLRQVDEITWMDKETKAKTVEKLHNMDVYVGFLESMKHNEILDEWYYVQINEKHYFDNLKRVLESGMSRTLKNFRKPYQITLDFFEMLSVNAFYNPQTNDIFIPAVILQFPFYDLGLEALNYGSIGTFLGHEVTHGFDDQGKKYDKDGNLANWWTEKSDKEYIERTKCYIDKYNKINITRLNTMIDGERSLGENIADDGGVHEALEAYRRHVLAHGEELKLPGLTQYSHEQIFFISYAHTWCSEYTTDAELMEAVEDEHLPDFARSVAALRNSPDFAQAWACPRGSPMNPEEERCKMWDD